MANKWSFDSKKNMNFFIERMMTLSRCVKMMEKIKSYETNGVKNAAISINEVAELCNTQSWYIKALLMTNGIIKVFGKDKIIVDDDYRWAIFIYIARRGSYSWDEVSFSKEFIESLIIKKNEDFEKLKEDIGL